MDDTFVDVLQDAAWFPAKVDRAANAVIFRRVNADAFNNVPFHDGRDGFLQSQARAVPIPALLAYTKEARAQSPSRLILHHSFCGSTFLARLLTQSGRTASYREPQVLIEACEGPAEGSTHDLTQALLKQFTASPNDGEAAFVKPSNWVNPLWVKSPAIKDCRLVLIHMDIEDYLVANLRGGTARMTYSINLLNFALNFTPEWKDAARDAEALLATSGLDAALRLLSILHSIQCRDFDHIMSRLDVKAMQITQQDLQRDPVDVSVSCAAWLGLPLERPHIIARNHEISSRHAKSLKLQAYRAADEAAVNDEIAARYAEEINSAADWAHAQSERQDKEQGSARA